MSMYKYARVKRGKTYEETVNTFELCGQQISKGLDFANASAEARRLHATSPKTST